MSIRKCDVCINFSQYTYQVFFSLSSKYDFGICMMEDGPIEHRQSAQNQDSKMLINKIVSRVRFSNNHLVNVPGIACSKRN